MIERRVLSVLEYDKILNFCKDYAVLDSTKEHITQITPSDDLEECLFLLKKTNEAFKLLYTYGVSGIEYFDPLNDELSRSKMDATLSMAELLRVARLLRSSRVVYNSVTAITDEEITALRVIAESIYCDRYLFVLCCFGCRNCSIFLKI